MNSEICYRFQSGQIANRFLNELKHWPVAQVKTKLLNGGSDVKVNYQFDSTGFDYTCAELDELAAKHAGEEVN
ncbi:hypothetical protein [Pseudoalteromonas arctica]|uniref:Orphan protein n=1 Tax=Pseudoalteromonas arctica TaxID=394751 RepID=A0A7Y0DUY7_9GAMM|nr:hypothetical protein [Pseudoalteromonas arctica]NMM42103.1 hypothetical protein [Pseudoalteromonas arctica]